MINNLSYFFNRTFVKKTNYPFISIILFIIVVVLNSIQYANNKDYLKDKVKKDEYPTTNIGQILFLIYDFIGINGFINYTPAFIFVFILTYLCVALIELNIGHLSLLFLLYLYIIFYGFWGEFTETICKNRLGNMDLYYPNLLSSWSSSFSSVMSLGFVLYLIQKNIINIYYRMLVIFIMLFIWGMCILLDRYIRYDNTDKKSSYNTCASLIYHSSAFLFGICCGGVLGN